MGANLVKRATVTALPALDSHAARVVLLVIATTAVDTDKRPSYFAGWEPLALALGYGQPLGETARRAVTRAVTELTDAGFVRAEPTRPRTWKRRYWLTLPGP